jgi:hypothetical protein
LYAHGSINLSSSSTAVLGLFFIPFYAVATIILGLVIGLLVHASVNVERMRLFLAWSVSGLAIVYGVGYAFYESSLIVGRESRFPYTAVSNINLQNRVISESDCKDRIEKLAFGDFDGQRGNEVVVLRDSRITILQPKTYEIKLELEYSQEDCKGCVHMYPYIVPDGKGDMLVASSDGVSGSDGGIRWLWESKGFSRVVPIYNSNSPQFLTYQSNGYIVLHDADGNTLWRKEIPVSDIGCFTTTDGDELPFAITGYGLERELTIYHRNGEQKQIIKLPEWSSSVQGIAWPQKGNLLIGYGSHFGVLDQNGKVILEHTIKDTSFNPYHGPEGVAVKLDSNDEPYLAVLSHGSSGYARSVLLIFNPSGELEWQEERKKLRAITVAPREDGAGEVLLVGGMEGVVEYKLNRVGSD